MTQDDMTYIEDRWEAVDLLLRELEEHLETHPDLVVETWFYRLQDQLARLNAAMEM